MIRSREYCRPVQKLTFENASYITFDHSAAKILSAVLSISGCPAGTDLDLGRENLKAQRTVALPLCFIYLFFFFCNNTMNEISWRPGFRLGSEIRLSERGRRRARSPRATAALSFLSVYIRHLEKRIDTSRVKWFSYSPIVRFPTCLVTGSNFI